MPPTRAANSPRRPPQVRCADRVKKLHEQLIEFIAESDDALMEKFFAQGGLSEDEMRAGLHAAVQKQIFTPLFVTSAETNIGVARLMDVHCQVRLLAGGPAEDQSDGR